MAKQIYSRIAVASDFENIDIPIIIAPWRYLDDSIKTTIAIKGLRAGQQHAREKYGMGMNDAVIICREYNAFLQAKRDFEAGKVVLINYNGKE